MEDKCPLITKANASPLDLLARILADEIIVLMKKNEKEIEKLSIEIGREIDKATKSNITKLGVLLVLLTSSIDSFYKYCIENEDDKERCLAKALLLLRTLYLISESYFHRIVMEE